MKIDGYSKHTYSLTHRHRQDQEVGGELDSHEELDNYLRVQTARPRGRRWCWTLKRAQERSREGGGGGPSREPRRDQEQGGGGGL